MPRPAEPLPVRSNSAIMFVNGAARPTWVGLLPPQVPPVPVAAEPASELPQAPAHGEGSRHDKPATLAGRGARRCEPRPWRPGLGHGRAHPPALPAVDGPHAGHDP